MALLRGVEPSGWNVAHGGGSGAKTPGSWANSPSLCGVLCMWDITLCMMHGVIGHQRKQQFGSLAHAYKYETSIDPWDQDGHDQQQQRGNNAQMNINPNKGARTMFICNRWAVQIL